MSDAPIDMAQEVVELLDKLKNSRDRLEDYVAELEGYKEHIMSIFPKKMDHRAKFVLEEKLKTVSSFYSILLNMVQEINKTSVQEIDVRRRLAGNDTGDELDIRQIVHELEKRKIKVDFSSSKETLQKQVEAIAE
jgi:hypothetical protein